jgi:class 3 adenylate cyclase
MEPASLGSGNRMSTVVFVDIVRYSAESVSRQAEMKAWFSTILATALEQSPASDRIVLDTGDGAALCFLGDPEDALFAANSLRSRVLEAEDPQALKLRIGINLGPVRVVKDINGHGNVIGDGINVAQRVMSFAAPNQILVSRSYYEVVSRLAPEYAQLFQYSGLHRDKHVREHEVYEVQLANTSARSPETAVEAGIPPGPAPGSPASDRRPARFDPSSLDQLAAALAREIGPVARLVVNQAAQRAADERVLGDMLAEHVPLANRAAFLDSLARVFPALRAGPEPAPPARSREPAGPPASERARARRDRSIDAEVLAQAERLLTLRIGPVARVLVRQAAKHSANARELFENLAVHIDDAESRSLFIQETEPLA